MFIRPGHPRRLYVNHLVQVVRTVCENDKLARDVAGQVPDEQNGFLIPEGVPTVDEACGAGTEANLTAADYVNTIEDALALLADFNEAAIPKGQMDEVCEVYPWGSIKSVS